jgi:hypothetical protein
VNSLIMFAELSLFALVLFLGGRVAARTQRIWRGTCVVWLGLTLITIPLAMVNLAWVDTYGTSSLAKAPRADLDRISETINLFPDGQHVLGAILFGWFYGLIAAGVGIKLARRKPSSQLTPAVAQT